MLGGEVKLGWFQEMEEDWQEEAGCPNVFSVRIVSIDYYMAPPVPDIDVCYSSFHGIKNPAPFSFVFIFSFLEAGMILSYGFEPGEIWDLG